MVNIYDEFSIYTYIFIMNAKGTDKDNYTLKVSK